MSSYPLAALQLKQSPFDPVGALQTAVQLGNAQANSELAKLRMEELRADATENQERRGALGRFRQDGGMTNPASLTHLAGHPDVFTPVQTAMTAQQTIAREANARAAQRVASLPEGSRERSEAWQEELERARSEGRMTPDAYQRYAAYQQPPQLLLQGIIQQGRALPTEADLRRQRRDEQIFGPDPLPSTSTAPAAAPPGSPRDPRSVRTNNPGAMEDGRFAQSQPGYQGTDGRYARFDNVDNGYRAMERLLQGQGYMGGGNNTVQGIVERWAPRTVDNNSTDGYIRDVSRRIGVRPDQPLTPEQVGPLAEAMAAYEAGRPVPRGTNAGRVTAQDLPPVPGISVETPTAPSTAPPAANQNAPPTQMGLRDRVRSFTREQQEQIRLLMNEDKTEDALKLINEFAGQGKIPDTIRTQGIKADQAYTNLTTALDSYQNLIKQTGAEAWHGDNMHALEQSRRNIQLQLKELFNLGVLNGPDLALMDSMIFDPTIGIQGVGPGGAIPVPRGLSNALSATFGSIGLGPSINDRAASSISRLKEMLRGIRNTQTQIIGLPNVPPPAGTGNPPPAGPGNQPPPASGGYRVIGVR